MLARNECCLMLAFDDFQIVIEKVSGQKTNTLNILTQGISELIDRHFATPGTTSRNWVKILRAFKNRVAFVTR
jgi:hypothetical protein